MNDFFYRRSVFKIISIAFILSLTFHAQPNLNQNIYEKNSGIKYAPNPIPVSTGKYLVGAFMCPLWNKDCFPDKVNPWERIKKYPEREPILGWYNEGDTNVTDWEIKFAVEHGISFFNVCWYRQKDNTGKQQVKELFGHWTASLFKSNYRKYFKFCIMYVDEGSIMGHIQSEKDLLENLLPYWIERYFKKPEYLKLDGKPVFTIYRPENFIANLGGEEKAAAAIAKMRHACIKAGFSGLFIMGEYHNPLDRKESMYKNLGLDAAVSYHWPSFTEKMPAKAPTDTTIARFQSECWSGLENVTELPSPPTVSVGWDSRPWGSTYYKGHWKLTPAEYKQLLESAKEYMNNQPKGSLQSKMLMLDNWNEYGEGHFIFPTKKEGFAYLNAVKDIFAISFPHSKIKSLKKIIK